jgi:heat shock protein HslJ
MSSWRMGPIRKVLLIALVVLTSVLAGCTSQPPTSQPVTTLPVPGSTLPVISPAISAALPEPIGGIWVLKTMTTDKDTPAGIPTVEINMTIKDDGTLVGNGGCNSYSAPYTITGGITTFGQGITIGPVVSTLMYCRPTSEQESTYFEILHDTSSYTVNNDILTLRVNAGNFLIFERAP